jgi:hypothetical protein
VRFGVTLPNLGVGDDPSVIVDLAREAEEAGWEGVFVWDTPYSSDVEDRVQETFDAWQLMTAIALRTERVLIGTMITPLPWRRPWEIARQSVTLDRLSKGRFVLCVGLGWVPEGGSALGEDPDRRTRARKLDEGLQILAGCWSGERFTFIGEHYRLKDVLFLPKPVRQIPIWVVGAWHRDQAAWPKKASMRRALRVDGVLPNMFDRSGVSYETTYDDIRAMADWIRAEHQEQFDIVCEGGGEKEDVNAEPAHVGGFADAGATWWLEAVWWSMYRHPGDPEPMRERIRRGPPKID